MDLAAEELQFLSIVGILRESVRIPNQSNRAFSLITLTLIFPLSLSILAHNLFTHPLLRRIQSFHSPSDVAFLILVQSLYLIFLFLFSLLSTAAVVLSVATLYSSSKPPHHSFSFSSLLSSALPRAFPRLARTFLFVSLLMTLYNVVFLASLTALVFAFSISSASAAASQILLGAAALLLLILYFLTHLYITAWWHLASVVSVLEPVCGWPAMRRSRELLRGKAAAAGVLVSIYLAMCWVISWVFGGVVVRGGVGVGLVRRVLVGGLLVGVLVFVNLVGLLVQSVFYYVCKSYHHELIDKTALFEHLGGYLGEYVPLKSSVQMQSFDDSL
ncbi:hypothetical protein Sjap_003722 [Stephania japonica]|uniref:Uncharacterized protein n=1 Tax=Stephania japonica TaxID=461633 RepID=A0AAP0KRF0_9MAGN